MRKPRRNQGRQGLVRMLCTGAGSCWCHLPAHLQNMGAQSSRDKYLNAELMFALAEPPGKTMGLKDTLGSAHLPVSPKPLKLAGYKFKTAFWHHSPVLCIQGCNCPLAWSKVQVPLWHHPTHHRCSPPHNLLLSSALIPKLECNTSHRALPILPSCLAKHQASLKSSLLCHDPVRGPGA